MKHFPAIFVAASIGVAILAYLGFYQKVQDEATLTRACAAVKMVLVHGPNGYVCVQGFEIKNGTF